MPAVDRSDIHVRRATAADATTLHPLLLELADHEEQGQHVHVDEDRWRQMLAQPEVVVLLAEHGGTAVGYVSAVRQLNLWVGGDILALDDLYVRNGMRGLGVGDRLMSALAEAAAADHLLIRWEMEVENEGAQRFYRRIGASLRTKVIAAWRPNDYAVHLAKPSASGRG